MAFPKIGGLAPDFSLQNQDEELVSLRDFIGNKNLVLYFYPKASTPGCTTQACGLRDIKTELAELNTAVLGISPDMPPALRKFIEKQNLNFDLLSDPDHAVADQYGAWGPKKFMGREYEGILRTTFLINKDGRLQHILDKVKTKTHDQEVCAWARENFQ